jgi:hypothetical protein
MAVQDSTGQNFMVEAWRKSGLGFVAFGPGIGYAFSPTFAAVLEPRLQILFPASGLSPAFYLGASKGF